MINSENINYSPVALNYSNKTQNNSNKILSFCVLVANYKKNARKWVQGTLRPFLGENWANLQQLSNHGYFILNVYTSTLFLSKLQSVDTTVHFLYDAIYSGLDRVIRVSSSYQVSQAYLILSAHKSNTKTSWILFIIMLHFLNNYKHNKNISFWKIQQKTQVAIERPIFRNDALLRWLERQFHQLSKRCSKLTFS